MLAIGLMSGTSGDGVGAALVEITGDEAPCTRLVAHITLPYDRALKERLFPLFQPATARLDEICRMNVLLAERFADAARAVAERAGVPLRAISVIGSHGQTICHLPPGRERGAADGVPSTLQLGSVSTLAEKTGVAVVGDFRLRDMAVGGEGAPLAPICDWLLFRSPSRTRVVQNFGGIGNATVLPAACAQSQVSAFDTGPGNALMDEAVRHLSGGTEEFDENGRRAALGSPSMPLVERWLRHPYFHRHPPKSTGREEFGAPAAGRYIAEAGAAGVGGNDLVATLLKLTVESAARHYERYVLPSHRLDEVIVGGGGAHNPVLVRALRDRLPGVDVQVHEAFGIPSDAKEPLAFALLAYLFQRGVPGNVPSATGAERPVVLGVYAPGRQ